MKKTVLLFFFLTQKLTLYWILRYNSSARQYGLCCEKNNNHTFTIGLWPNCPPLFFHGAIQMQNPGCSTVTEFASEHVRQHVDQC